MSESATEPDTHAAFQPSIGEAEEPVFLFDGQTAFGKVVRPFIQADKVMGVVLKFAGTHETALLHRKNVLADRKSKDVRLADLTPGSDVAVKLNIFGSPRNIWASEVHADYNLIVSRLLAEKTKRVLGKVVNQIKYGVFVELTEGAGAGKKGLVHARNMRKDRTFHSRQYKPGEPIWVAVLDAKIDDEATLRIDLTLSEPN